ncbi:MULTISPECIES: helix-turn-helix domain-containing protein [unclassified Methanoculleus]|uniref:winged helix-turn-helix transcriptional regulator n=1 Tax=unclassified Methanoculleus TaxID=2619537 RepID=UPI0025EE2B77|nr:MULTISPECIES: helix-turn-helix domain-containing protein [unclassified Methanoculleus]MCK9317368.1 helix-turn-helix transcriptional regulator [Methanoculleus sp.]MDD2253071.1 helix-turn-helix domain-containing protein [Methanoculleus sp.]MDD2788077.1 helix-turn-helix domain-containing protein [Methanoculleus sp.]MDD3216031.1 helix-turn-helix domain-containing protein [Methanoculleus sp.]MDD4313275.1 helix-turn-helix domain-containing protein [Methanoculleus sp.]
MQNECTVNQTVKYLGKKWTLLIILELYKGEGYTRRFTEVKDRLPGITAKVLSARLKELEEEGLVEKRVEAGTVPVRSDYTLTASGLGLVEVIKDIKRWALRWKIENRACGAQDCHDCVL